MTELKHLRTLKAASAQVGPSISFFKKLVKQGRLRKYRIDRTAYISLVEFESLAIPARELKKPLL
jgi:hypothetical protein